MPPTPAPANPGLPSTPQSGGELRPGLNLGPGQVTQVQQLLQQGGFYRGPLDGQISGATRASVRAFQQARNLPATGELDGPTATALGMSRSASGTPASSAGQTSTTTNPLTTGTGSATTGATNANGATTQQGPPFPLSQQPQSPRQLRRRFSSSRNFRIVGPPLRSPRSLH